MCIPSLIVVNHLRLTQNLKKPDDTQYILNSKCMYSNEVTFVQTHTLIFLLCFQVNEAGQVRQSIQYQSVLTSKAHKYSATNPA